MAVEDPKHAEWRRANDELTAAREAYLIALKRDDKFDIQTANDRHGEATLAYCETVRQLDRR